MPSPDLHCVTSPVCNTPFAFISADVMLASYLLLPHQCLNHNGDYFKNFLEPSKAVWYHLSDSLMGPGKETALRHIFAFAGGHLTRWKHQTGWKCIVAGWAATPYCKHMERACPAHTHQVYPQLHDTLNTSLCTLHWPGLGGLGGLRGSSGGAVLKKVLYQVWS